MRHAAELLSRSSVVEDHSWSLSYMFSCRSVSQLVISLPFSAWRDGAFKLHVVSFSLLFSLPLLCLSVGQCYREFSTNFAVIVSRSIGGQEVNNYTLYYAINVHVECNLHFYYNSSSQPILCHRDKRRRGGGGAWFVVGCFRKSSPSSEETRNIGSSVVTGG